MLTPEMEHTHYDTLLESHGIKPTANRIIMAKALDQASRPQSMKELEDKIMSLDKSSIFRTLTIFKEHHLVHVIEDGEGSMKYELCYSHHGESDDDEHVHFHCMKCHRTICLHDTPLPHMNVPEGFELHSVNLILKGICPCCRNDKHHL